MPTFAERLNEALEHKSISAAELARALNVADATISNYRKGIYAPKQRRSEKIARFLNVSVDWLLGADVPMNPLNLMPPTITDDVVTFPILGSIATGYDEATGEDWSGGVIEIPTVYLKGRDRNDFFVLEVNGNSMYPLYQEEDKVLVLKQDYIENNGDIGAVIYDGECATLKRIVVSEDMVRLIPVNPEYQAKELKGADINAHRILGVPRLLVREID